MLNTARSFVPTLRIYATAWNLKKSNKPPLIVNSLEGNVPFLQLAKHPDQASKELLTGKARDLGGAFLKRQA
jgi:hypothetical protein